MTTGADGSQNRAFFRVDTTAIVEYTPIPEELVNSAIVSMQGEHGIGAKKKVGSALDELNNKLNDSIGILATSNREVSHAVDLLNSKVDHVLNQLKQLKQQNIAQPKASGVGKEQIINLSGGGLMAYSAEKIEEGTAFNLKIILLPSYHEIETVSVAVKQFDAEEIFEDWGHYQTAFKFKYIHNDCQEKIIRHVNEKQAKILQERRVARQ